MTDEIKRHMLYVFPFIAKRYCNTQKFTDINECLSSFKKVDSSPESICFIIISNDNVVVMGGQLNVCTTGFIIWCDKYVTFDNSKGLQIEQGATFYRVEFPNNEPLPLEDNFYIMNLDYNTELQQHLSVILYKFLRDMYNRN